MFIVNCLLKNKFNILTCSILFIYLSQNYKQIFHAKKIIWLSVQYKLLVIHELNYNWQHCSAISLTVVMLCICSKRVYVRFTEIVCKAVRLAFLCQTSAISFTFIPIPCFRSIIIVISDWSCTVLQVYPQRIISQIRLYSNSLSHFSYIYGSLDFS